MKINFIKMHGLGNDYIYINCIDNKKLEEYIPSVAEKISKRRFGIGSDGVILICASSIADVKMRIFNSDGSEGKMCGNGIRCLAKFVYENKISSAVPLKVETLSGIKLVYPEENLNTFKVDMGHGIISGRKEVITKEEKINLTMVDIGNPHAVIFVDDVSKAEVKRIGEKIEKHFIGGVNVEFVEIINKNTLKMRVWERGSGETTACGTGACASVLAACYHEAVNKDKSVLVKLDGGELTVKICKNDNVFLTGEAAMVYKGVIYA